jgi:SAM-dependent methyltransferase
MRRRDKIIPFWGVEYPGLFEIERRCIDRDGAVIRYLDALLPASRILDIGAGDGFTAALLSKADRFVVPLEPAAGMIDRSRRLPWVRGIAQELPFPARAFAAAYATWAYFFPNIGHGDAGLQEAHRVVIPKGAIVVVDNAGGDEFCALLPHTPISDSRWWSARGFRCHVLETSFRFDSLEEARELLSFYGGERARKVAKREIEHTVAVYVGQSQGA